MIFVFRVESPGSDLDGETWSFQDTTEAIATDRAASKLADTFRLASAERRAQTWIALVATYPSREAMRRAEEAAARMPLVGVMMPAGKPFHST